MVLTLNVKLNRLFLTQLFHIFGPAGL